MGDFAEIIKDKIAVFDLLFFETLVRILADSSSDLRNGISW